MPTVSYQSRRGQLETYFNRTAVEAWRRLTSDAPVSGIRATVRAGRDEMRRTLLDWLPADMTGMRVLDAGCGTGALAVDMARRGADVLAVDISESLIEVARARTPDDLAGGTVDFRVGDMLDPGEGRFHRVVAMDSLIHYATRDVLGAVGELVARSERGVLFTFAPRTPALTAMHAIGRLFPRGNRAPAIEPVSERRLRRLIEQDHGLRGWAVGNSHRVSSGFYTSQALELAPG